MNLLALTYLYLQENHLKKSLCEQVAGLVSGFGVQMKVSFNSSVFIQFPMGPKFLFNTEVSVCYRLKMCSRCSETDNHSCKDPSVVFVCGHFYVASLLRQTLAMWQQEKLKIDHTVILPILPKECGSRDDLIDFCTQVSIEWYQSLWHCCLHSKFLQIICNVIQ